MWMNHCLLKGMSQEQIGDMDNPAAHFAFPQISLLQHNWYCWTVILPLFIGWSWAHENMDCYWFVWTNRQDDSQNRILVYPFPEMSFRPHKQMYDLPLSFIIHDPDGVGFIIISYCVDKWSCGKTLTNIFVICMNSSSSFAAVNAGPLQDSQPQQAQLTRCH